MQENQVNIWAVGGCGGEIGSAFEGEVAKGLHSMTYVDTSRANLRDSALDDDHIYIFKDAAGRELDGSGKKRDENAELICSQIPGILNKHTPGKFNIVVFSLSGGSAAVAGPALVANLLERGERVVCCIVASFDDERQTINADRTFKGLMAAAEGLKRPVIVSYHMNGENGKSEQDVNLDVQIVISQLCVLFSGENRRLDSADLENFLNHPRVTGLEPTITELNTFMGYEWTKEHDSPIAFCTLYPKDATKVMGVNAIYSCDGFVPESSPIREATSFVLSTDRLGGIIKQIADEAKRFVEHRNARQQAPKVGDETVAEAKNSGFLLF